jgi:membrane protease YdiL (CAAX protease family)
MPDRPAMGMRLALCVVPLIVQVLAQIVAVTVLHVTRNAATAAYSPAFGLSILAGYVGLIAATRWVSRTIREPLPLHWPGTAATAGFAILGLVAGAAVFALVDPLFGGATHAQQRQFNPEPYPGGLHAATGLAIVALVFAVVGPFGEELYFRGLLMTTLGGGVPALVIQAAVFAAVHLIPAALLLLFLDGLILGLIRWRTASIWPGYVVHAINNAAALAFAVWG